MSTSSYTSVGGSARAMPAAQGDQEGRFVGTGEPADVAVLVVTYNNAAHLDRLVGSLRREATRHRLRVVVADNASTDGTLEQVRRHEDVVAFATGGNLGYAAGINLARARAGVADALLVLNPDLRVEEGAAEALLSRLRHPGVGVVVPRIVDPTGETYPSLRREPSVSRLAGDVLLGPYLPRRPHWLSELELDRDAYRQPHEVDWATGAAILVERDVADAVGDWDERFFLYSEETDFFRRVRAQGRAVWYEPAAVVEHAQGGSGSFPLGVPLLVVNRLRYVEKHQTRGRARAFRALLVVRGLMRMRSPGQRASLRFLVRRSTWDRLPAARWDVPDGADHRRDTGDRDEPDLREDAADCPSGSVVIPAHDEAAVLARTLRPLAPLARAGRVEVVVACNGCTDDTAGVARQFDGVGVVVVPEASKTAALNAADALATRWPRLYLDADIELTPRALRDLFALLHTETVLAARPRFVYDTAGAGPLVRSYYRARARVPSLSQALWGAGAYALTEKGHVRIGEFPPVTGDDLYVDACFDETEKQVVDTDPVVVRTPRQVRALLGVLGRACRGNGELLGGHAAPTVRTTVGELLRTATGPACAADAAVYCALALTARAVGARRSTGGWERDVTTRVRGG